jgi:probable RNA-binding protein EIF1AD
MGRGKRVESFLSNLPEPTPSQAIVCITGTPGGNLLQVQDAEGRDFLCRVPAKFRNRVWSLKGGYLIVDMAQGDEDGEAVGKVRAVLAHHLYRDQLRHLKSRGLWPSAFESETVANGSAGRGVGDDYDIDLLMQRNPNQGRGMPGDSSEEEEEGEEEEGSEAEEEGEAEEAVLAGGDEIPPAVLKAAEAASVCDGAASTPPGNAAPRSTLSSLGPLPPIDAVTLPSAPLAPPRRTEKEQAELEAELDTLHEALGVRRGHALSEALKPELKVPMPPVHPAVSLPSSNASERAAATVMAVASGGATGDAESNASTTAPTAASGSSLPQPLA